MLNVKDLRKSLPILVLVGVLVWCMCYSDKGREFYAPIAGAAGVKKNGDAPTVQNAGCALGNGVGLASSLLPREVSSAEDFGQFAPDEILRGQNFLDPRQQIGFPETIGGTLRNSNQTVRAEPPNPKSPYVWQNSTITPDLMRRPLD
tara:strand:+ start:6280 stop:6720 length:441 start_codon:yes stop_codon:yes gene_type:complete